MKKIDWKKVEREIQDIKFSKNKTKNTIIQIVWIIIFIIISYYMMKLI